jgi:flagellar motor switch protein FliN/FliY
MAAEGTKEVSKKRDPKNPSDIAFLNDVQLTVTVDLGRAEITIERLLQLKKGSVFEVEKLCEEPLDVRVNSKLVARGEAVIVNEKFGVRVTQIVTPENEEIF